MQFQRGAELGGSRGSQNIHSLEGTKDHSFETGSRMAPSDGPGCARGVWTSTEGRTTMLAVPPKDLGISQVPLKVEPGEGKHLRLQRPNGREGVVVVVDGSGCHSSVLSCCLLCFGRQANRGEPDRPKRFCSAFDRSLDSGRHPVTTTPWITHADLLFRKPGEKRSSPESAKPVFWGLDVKDEDHVAPGTPLQLAKQINHKEKKGRLLMPLVASLLLVAMPFVTSSILSPILPPRLMPSHSSAPAGPDRRRPVSGKPWSRPVDRLVPPLGEANGAVSMERVR